MTHRTRPSLRPFPRPCSECGQEQVNSDVIGYDAEVKHDGKLHKFHIPRLTVNRCNACGEVYFDAITSEEILQALRDRLNLLSPQQIRNTLNRLRLSQKDFGKQIGLAAETISRWMSGRYIQSRTNDNLMRMFFRLGGEQFHITTLPESSTDAANKIGVVNLITVTGGTLRNTTRWNAQCKAFETLPTQRTAAVFEDMTPAESNLLMAV